MTTPNTDRTILGLAIILSVVSLVLMVTSLVALHQYSDRLDRLATTNCHSIEGLKRVQRKSALATIAGDQALLDSHDLHGVPLPVPRQAIEDDIAAKQEVVTRFQPRKCP